MSGTGQVPRRPTVADVAKAAHVSVGTVSHVLSNARYVRPQTRARVELAITEIGFRPNRVARALIEQSTNSVGMVVPDVTNPFFAELMRGVEDVMTEADIAVIFGNSDNDPIKERRYLDGFQERLVDGLILAATEGEPADALSGLAVSLPTVLVDRTVAGWGGDCVVGDNVRGMEIAVDHLVSRGHIRIGLVNGNPHLSTANEREAGFRAALRRHGLEPTVTSDGEFTLDSGRAQTLAILGGTGRPTAICAGNDLLALAVVSAADEIGVRIPEELSVVGYDDITYARLASPPLTTVRVSAYAMGSAAARQLLRRLSGDESPPARVVLPPELIIRRSTDLRRNE